MRHLQFQQVVEANSRYELDLVRRSEFGCWRLLLLDSMVQLSRATAVNFRLGRAPRPADAKVTVAECSRFITAVLCVELLKPALSLDERAIHVCTVCRATETRAQLR